MFKNALNGLAALSVVSMFALVGCGPTADDVVGTWTYSDDAMLKSDCGDLGANDTSLAGGTVTFALGTDHDLIMTGGDCNAAYSFSGGELKADGYEGTGCTGDEGTNPEGVTTEGEIIWTYASGEPATLTPSGSVTVTDTNYGFTCVVSYSGTLTK